MSAQNESMYAQYLAWYQGHRAKYGPQTAVLMQVGKFFEIYDRLNLTDNSTNTNIREIADLCSLNLSESRESDTSIKLFGGFPEQSLPKFERQLLDAGYTVVIVVQKKNSRGDVEERTVERISSPGIYENRYSALSRIPDTRDSCLLGILLEPNDDKSVVVGLTPCSCTIFTLLSGRVSCWLYCSTTSRLYSNFTIASSIFMLIGG